MIHHAPRSQLLRVLGLGFGLAAVVGGVVGQGILRAPGIVAGAIPHPSLILAFWLGGGILAAVTAFALVEVASSVPRAGGPYAFARRAFGPFAATLVGWGDWLIGVIAISFFSVVFGEYWQRLGLATGASEGAIAVAMIAVVTAINWTSTRTSGVSQGIGSALKGVGLLMLIGLLFAAPDTLRAQVQNSSPTVSLAAAVVAMRAIQNTYAGWNGAAYFCEELHAPERNIARAVFGGILLVTLLYVLVNAAMLHVLTPQQLAASKLPAADAIGKVLGPTGDTAMNWFAVVSVFAIANLYAMSLSRVGYAMAHGGVLPSIMARVASSGTPRVALVFAACVAALLATSNRYDSLIAMSAPLSILMDLSVSVAAIRIRAVEPALPRPFRMPLFPLPVLLGLALNGLLLVALIYEDPTHSLLGIVVVAAIGLSYKAHALIRRHVR